MIIEATGAYCSAKGKNKSTQPNDGYVLANKTFLG